MSIEIRVSPSTLSWFIRERSCDLVLGDMEATGLITVVLYNRWIFLAAVKRLIVYFGVFQFPTCIMESNYMLCILLWSRGPVQNACLKLCCCFFWHNRVAAWISSGQWETAPSAIFADLIQSHILKVRLSSFFLFFFFGIAGNLSGGAEPVAMQEWHGIVTKIGQLVVVDFKCFCGRKPRRQRTQLLCVQLTTAANNAEKVGGDCLR